MQIWAVGQRPAGENLGGGRSGLEAARVTAERGHRVTLKERSDGLGGQFRLAGYQPIYLDVPGTVQPDEIWTDPEGYADMANRRNA